MSVTIFDPAAPPAGAWPEGDDPARRYILGIARGGVEAMVSNVRTRWLALRSGDRVLPLTVNDGETGDSYVCLPHSAYILYARQELELVDTGALKPLLRALIALFDRVLLAAGINRIVHVDNMLLSTNLHGDWAGEDVPAIRAALARLYPDHIVAIRSLDRWSCPELLAACAADGWTMLASRQIWVTDDTLRDWRPRNSVQNDRRLLAASGLAVEELETMSEEDAARIAELYHMLYVGKYSPLNPVFTPAWIAMTHEQDILRYRGARGADGRLMAVAGSLVRGNVLTPPIVGYDTGRPQKEGLYRIAAFLFSEVAAREGLRLNGSAGAADFKRRRGAHGVIEYSAMYIRHLSLWRRLALVLVAGLLDHVAAPMMKRRGL
ncbi:MAG TPA: hypothetical protein VIT38_16925 [Allosphingosinicella sp.]|jgi:hypothetical protein